MDAAYIECSSKEMRGVENVFSLAVDTVVQHEEQAHFGSVVSVSGNGGIPSGGKKVKRSCMIL